MPSSNEAQETLFYKGKNTERVKTNPYCIGCKKKPIRQWYCFLLFKIYYFMYCRGKYCMLEALFSIIVVCVRLSIIISHPLMHICKHPFCHRLYLSICCVFQKAPRFFLYSRVASIPLAICQCYPRLGCPRKTTKWQVCSDGSHTAIAFARYIAVIRCRFCLNKIFVWKYSKTK